MRAVAVPGAMRAPTRGRMRAAALVAVTAAAACAPERPDIIPLPADVEVGRATFTLDGSVSVALAEPDDDELRRLLDLWAAPYRAAGALALEPSPEGRFRVGVDGAGTPESYRLQVDEGGIVLSGADHAGVFYGLQTLSQLLPPDAETAAAGGPFEVPVTTIQDEPRFRYRGMHLDVGRHFYGPDEVERYLDLLARYKINHFHWHLTEDQGWRIQIDAYPRLTEVGAYRDETHVGHGRDPFVGDGQTHGGFYTKDEVRDIVAYAAERYITVVPEIEMPGHARAALAAYPELACTEGPFEVAETWGVFEDVYCPYEETFDFLEAVLSEVMELFPGPYVHVGGDEAPTTRWESNPFVEELMVREGLTDVAQVQPYFMRRIQRFLAEHGRRMIGWEEILGEEFGPRISEDAIIMSWLGLSRAIEATRRGHEVVMTPTSHVYFDYYQAADTASEPFAIGGFLPLDTVYAFEPVPRQLRERDAARIIGAQANVWTEYMTSWDHVEYMLLPRMLALAEVVWSPPGARDFDSFRRRLEWHLARFDALGVGYRPPEPR